MKKEYTYYRGVFNSQFSFPKKFEPSAHLENTMKLDFFNLEIEGKRELINAEKISEKEFLSLVGCTNDSKICDCELHNSGNSFQIIRNENSSLEVLQKNAIRELRKDYDQITLVFFKDASNFSNSQQDFFTSGVRHGKLSALAFVRVFKEIVEENKLIPKLETEVQKVPIPIKPVVPNAGCFPASIGGGSTAFGVGGRTASGGGGDVGSGNSHGGCFGGGGPGIPGTFLGAGGNGCFPSSTFGGNGCFSLPNLGTTGCFSIGGLWQLLQLLLGLGFLLYLLSQIRSCDPTPKDRVVYVYDTIQMVKYDTLKIVEKTEVKITSTEKISLPNVQFKTNSDELLEGSLPDIQSLADFLIRNDSVTAIIEGHTDDIGDAEDNLQLSKARAESVKKLLVKLGINEGRIATEGYGDTRPKAVLKDSNPPKPDTSPEGRLINRRVEVKLDNLGKTTKTETSNQ